MKLPAVSVLMPVYNCEKYVGAAIQSILNQTFADFELLVIDDASTDQTASVIAAIDDRRVLYRRNPSNLGIAGSRNRALTLARGEMIAWLDADDIARPSRLLDQVEFLNRHPEYVLCSTNAVSIDETGQVTSGPWWKTTSPNPAWSLFWENPIAQSSVMVRSSVIRENKLEYSHHHVPAEDYDLWLRLLQIGRIHRLPGVLLEYRILPGSAFHANRDKAFRASLESNRELVKTLFGSDVPPFHQEMTVFLGRHGTHAAQWRQVCGWQNEILRLGAERDWWSASETKMLRKDIRRRTRFFFLSRQDESPSLAESWDFFIHSPLSFLWSRMRKLVELSVKRAKKTLRAVFPKSNGSSLEN